MAATMIRIEAKTRDKLKRLKEASGESYDSLLIKLLALLPEGDDEGLYTDAFRIGLIEAELDIRGGDTVSLEAAKRRLGL